MKTTLELPDALVKAVELRVAHEGRNLDDVAADLLRIGLANGTAAIVPRTPPLLKTHPVTKLPYFECAPDAPASRMTPQQLIELEHRTQTEEDLERDSAYLFDSNVWVALTFNTHPAHRAASDAFLLATEQRPAVFCRATQQSYLRLASNPSVLRAYNATGLTNRDALNALVMFMARPVVGYRKEPADIVSLWHRLADLPSASPKVWMDAYLAAFAITGGMTMLTLDREFLSFEHAGLALILVEPS